MQAIKNRHAREQQQQQFGASQRPVADSGGSEEQEPSASLVPCHWVHIDGAAAGGPLPTDRQQAAAACGYDVASAVSASNGGGGYDGPLAAAGQLHGDLAVACGAGGGFMRMESPWAVHADMGGGGGGGACGGGGSSEAGQSLSAARLELLRQCQREVAGSLDDVVGLE
jgi:hypothetical protein